MAGMFEQQEGFLGVIDPAADAPAEEGVYVDGGERVEPKKGGESEDGEKVQVDEKGESKDNGARDGLPFAKGVAGDGKSGGDGGGDEGSSLTVPGLDQNVPVCFIRALETTVRDGWGMGGACDSVHPVSVHRVLTYSPPLANIHCCQVMDVKSFPRLQGKVPRPYVEVRNVSSTSLMIIASVCMIEYAELCSLWHASADDIIFWR